jgi:nucleoside-diphosphate kinase
LLEYITGSLHYPGQPQKQRVIAIVYQGPNAVKKIRDIAGPTNPHQAREKNPGCIRSLGTVVILRNEQGKEIGQRMDNLLHASATVEEAEREIKLWFKPDDIPPLMRAYPVKRTQEHFYYAKDKLHVSYVPGSVGIIAPGDCVWASDLHALEQIIQKKQPPVALRTIVAKYLINNTPA